MLLKGMEFDTAHFITDVSGKYPRLWALKGAHPVTVNRWYKFGALASIRTIAPSFREILELPDWVGMRSQLVLSPSGKTNHKHLTRTRHSRNSATTPYSWPRDDKDVTQPLAYIRSSTFRRKHIEN
ncbi:hypothetical protein ACS0TY_022997 [Phlomoides rotata]